MRRQSAGGMYTEQQMYDEQCRPRAMGIRVGPASRRVGEGLNAASIVPTWEGIHNP